MNPDSTSTAPINPQAAYTISQPTDPKAAQFMNAVNYAKQNPDSPFATELQTRIQSGQMNDYMQAAGYDPSKFVQQPKVSPTTASTPTAQPDVATNFGTDVASNFKEAQGSMGDVVERSLTGKQNIAESLLQGLGVGAKLGNDVIGSGLKALYDANVPKPAQDAIGSAISEAIQNSPVLKAGVDAAKQGMDSYNNWAKTDPKNAATVGALINIPLFAAQFAGVGELGKAGEPIASKVGEVASGAVQGTKDLATGAKNIATNGVESVKGAITGKNLDAIIATPESEVSKLAPSERKAWFDNQQQQLTSKSTATEAKIKTDLASKTQAAQSEAEALQRKIAVSSRDETIALRPQIRTALANQSATYRKLVDEAIAPHVDTPVSATELKQFVEGRFPNDPGMADAVNAKLGLTEDNVAAPLKPGELPTTGEGEPIAHGGQFNPSKADTTIGKIYEQTKGLKQDIGTAATKGARTYTADEKLTDDCIHTLSDFMKSKGVDMSAPNQFWSKYAPIRNQLVSEAKPFLQTGTQTKTFANTLIRVAKGADVNNENFISSVEDILGKPIGRQTKAAVAALDQNAKTQIANELEAQSKILDNKLATEALNKNLSARQFEIERQAKTRDLFRSILKGAGITTGTIAGDKIIKATTGIGF